VDIVLTTRELARLFLDQKINLKKIKPQKADDPFGVPTGAGVIYGSSGGVMESALRTGYFKLTGENMKDVDFKEIRGADGIKRQVVRLCSPVKSGKEQCTEVRVAVTNEIKNAKIILEELKKDPKKYHFVEVMACPSGCIGGGGQPMPVDMEIRKKRAQSLYDIDAKSEMRLAHENPRIKEIYEEYLTNEKIIKKILHTKFSQKSRSLIKKSKRKYAK
jgi:iron only hydrogenase large subunit-like protein